MQTPLTAPRCVIDASKFKVKMPLTQAMHHHLQRMHPLASLSLLLTHAAAAAYPWGTDSCGPPVHGSGSSTDASGLTIKMDGSKVVLASTRGSFRGFYMKSAQDLAWSNTPAGASRKHMCCRNSLPATIVSRVRRYHRQQSLRWHHRHSPPPHRRHRPILCCRQHRLHRWSVLFHHCLRGVLQVRCLHLSHVTGARRRNFPISSCSLHAPNCLGSPPIVQLTCGNGTGSPSSIAVAAALPVEPFYMAHGAMYCTYSSSNKLLMFII